MNIQPEPRIGDAEREAAAAALGEHFAAGRLDREEYDERSGRVWAAKTNSDLWPLFADLPSPQARPRSRPETSSHHAQEGSPPASGRRSWMGVPLLPLVIVVVVLMYALPGAPWLLFLLVWLFFAGVFRHGHSRRRCQAASQHR